MECGPLTHPVSPRLEPHDCVVILDGASVCCAFTFRKRVTLSLGTKQNRGLGPSENNTTNDTGRQIVTPSPHYVMSPPKQTTTFQIRPTGGNSRRDPDSKALAVCQFVNHRGHGRSQFQFALVRRQGIKLHSRASFRSRGGQCKPRQRVSALFALDSRLD